MAKGDLDKSYLAHEDVYRGMKADGICNWFERSGGNKIDPSIKGFVLDVLGQKWQAKGLVSGGRVMEFGCGTGTMIRWLGKKSWQGVGVDISPTAIDMARGLTDNIDIDYIAGDVTDSNTLIDLDAESFDMVLDGQCFHCLLTGDDRDIFLRQASRLLKPGGCLVLITMARPILQKHFRREHGYIKDSIVYTKMPKAKAIQYSQSIEVDGQYYIATRYLEHWKGIIRRLKKNGFKPMLHRVNVCFAGDPLSYLCVAAVK